MIDYKKLDDTEMEAAIMAGEFGPEVQQAFTAVCLEGMFGCRVTKKKAIRTIKEHLRTGYPMDVSFLDAESADGRPRYRARLEFFCRKP